MTEDDFKVMWGEDYKTGEEMEHALVHGQQLDVWKNFIFWTVMMLANTAIWAAVIIGVVLVATR